MKISKTTVDRLQIGEINADEGCARVGKCTTAIKTAA